MTEQGSPQDHKGKGCMRLSHFLIIVVILLILAAIAIPDYMKSLAPGKNSEAKPFLGAIFTAQNAYKIKHGAFARSPDIFGKLAWHPDWANRYSYYCGEEVFTCHKNKCETPPQALGPDWPLPVRPMASDTAFVCIAVGNIDNDATWDAWTINEKKELVHLVDDVNE